MGLEQSLEGFSRKGSLGRKPHYGLKILQDQSKSQLPFQGCVAKSTVETDYMVRREGGRGMVLISNEKTEGSTF